MTHPFQSPRRYASCSWTDASLPAVLAPHIALATDDSTLLVLHFPPCPQLGFLERTGNQVALRLFASVAPEILELGDGLDAFGNDAKPQAVRQGDDRLGDCFIVLVLFQAADKTLVDLDGLNRQAGEAGQARITGSEIVQRFVHGLEQNKN